MDDEIKVMVVNQFGRKRVFPVCEKAKLFCEIAGTETLTDKAVQAIKQLGYDITVVPEVTSL